MTANATLAAEMAYTKAASRVPNTHKERRAWHPTEWNSNGGKHFTETRLTGKMVWKFFPTLGDGFAEHRQSLQRGAVPSAVAKLELTLVDS